MSLVDRILYNLIDTDQNVSQAVIAQRHTKDIRVNGFRKITNVAGAYRNIRRPMQPAFLKNVDGSYTPLCLDEYLRMRLSDMGAIKAGEQPDERGVYRKVLELMYDPLVPETMYANQTTFTNWNSGGFSETDRGDSYKLLMRMIFALKLSYADAKEFCHNIGARQLYALDCHDHVFILALTYNEIVKANGLAEITYDQAIAVAERADSFVCEKIQEEIDAKLQEDPDRDIKAVCSEVLREMYEDARAKSSSDAANKITQFTETAANSAKNNVITGLTSKDPMSFEDIAIKSVKENTAAMFRARRKLMSLILTYLYGDRDAVPDDLDQDIRNWLNKFNLTNRDSRIAQYLIALAKDDHNALMDVFATDTNSTQMHEDIARSNISDGRINAFKTAFSLSFSSLVTGSIRTLFTREQLFKICFSAREITPTMINMMLEAAGESRLNENFSSDCGIIACQTILDYYMSGEQYTPELVRKVFIDYLENTDYGLECII